MEKKAEYKIKGRGEKSTGEDDGKGFDAAGYNRRRSGDGLEDGGLQRVRYLMEHMAGGSVDIRSFPDIGTIITLHIPKNVQGGTQER